MLHILKENSCMPSGITRDQIIRHRDDGCGQKDRYDTSETIYAAYVHPKYGLVGTARLLPMRELPLMDGTTQKLERPTYSLISSHFHVDDDSPLYHLREEVRETHMDNLVRGFYHSLMRYVENLSVLEGISSIFFKLDEEDADFLHGYGDRELTVMNIEEREADEERLLSGLIQMSDLTSGKNNGSGDSVHEQSYH